MATTNRAASASEPDTGPGPELDLPIGGRRLLVVAGKGGVGRSSAAAAVALEAASSGRRVLAVDSIADGGLSVALGSAGRRQSSLEVLELDTQKALDEYLKIYLRLPIPPSRLGPLSRIFDYVATAAPGVREILTIGKVAWEVEHGPWDLVVVDGPASGHIVELLAAADTLQDLIGFGPLVEQTEWIAELLADRTTSGVVMVTVAEELPVAETIELHRRITTETGVAITGLLVNRCPEILSRSSLERANERGRDTSPLAVACRLAAARSTEAALWLDTLDELPLEPVVIGWTPDPVVEMRAGVAAWLS